MVSPSNRTFLVKDDKIVAIIDHTQAAIKSVNLPMGVVAMQDTQYYERFPGSFESTSTRPWHIRTPREFSGDIDRLAHPTRKRDAERMFGDLVD